MNNNVILHQLALLFYYYENNKYLDNFESFIEKTKDNELFSHLSFSLTNEDFERINQDIKSNITGLNDKELIKSTYFQILNNFINKSYYNICKVELLNLFSKLVKESKVSPNKIYSSTMGISNLLETLSKEYPLSTIYGDDISVEVVNLAKINLILNEYDTNRFNYHLDNSLTNENKYLSKFDLIISDQPFRLKELGSDNELKGKYFDLLEDESKRNLTDFSFLLTDLAKLSDKGYYFTLIPPALLFRESGINVRKLLIDELNYLDLVIQLPEGILSYTRVAPVILGFRKNRLLDEEVTFTNYYDLNLTNYDTKKVTSTKIKENDFNLNVSRYISKKASSLKYTLNELISKHQIIEKELENQQNIVRDLIRGFNK